MATARIVVDLGESLGRVEPNIYGHFIEHLGRCINGGIWGEMLRARKFTGFDDDHNGLPDPWTVGARNPFVLATVEHDPEWGATLRLRLLRDDDARRGVSHPGLAVRAGRRYHLQFWAQASGQVREVVVSLGGSEVSCHVQAGRWELVQAELVARWDDDDAVLNLFVRGPGELLLRAPSLMLAEDHAQGGLRADVLELVRAIRPPVVRWPGGCFADAYRWRDGIGPRDRRPPRFDPAWRAWEPNDFGTDEFVRWCRAVGAEPYICVNTGSASAEDAAAWVQYCNGSAQTEWGRLRAENGHPEPFGVKWWGVGNETYGSWEIGNLPAEEYARGFLHFAERMRAADPSIRLIAVGADPERYPEWNRTVLQIAGEAMDCLSLHWYGPHTRDDARPEEMYRAIVAAPVDIERRLRLVEETIAQVLGPESAVTIAFDEWNVWLDASGDTGIEERYELRDALLAVGVFNLLTRRCRKVTMANLAQLVNVLPAISTSRTGAWGTPLYHAFRLHAGSTQPVAVACQVEGPTFEAPALGNLPALASVPYLDASATAAEDGRTVTLSVVNRHPSEDITAEVELGGREVVAVTVAELNAASTQARGSEALPDAVSISIVEPQAPTGPLVYSFPAHSATLLTLRLE